jgi:hypothetical protein
VSQAATDSIVSISQDTVRFDAGLTLSRLYDQLGGRELLVEPLSANQPIGRFMAQGGLGWGSAREGSFAASVCRLKTDQFEYGSDVQTLYNVGYPLQRLAEGPEPALLGGEPMLGEIRDLTVYVRPRAQRVAVFSEVKPTEIDPPAGALDVFYVNQAAASSFALDGVERAGLVSIYPKDLAPKTPALEGLWEKRFVEDALSPGQTQLKVLTQPSALGKCLECAESAGAVLFVLFTHLGPLVLMAGAKEPLQEVRAEILSLPLTWELPAV